MSITTYVREQLGETETVEIEGISYELRLASRAENGDKTSVCDKILAKYDNEATAIIALMSNDTFVAMHHTLGATCAEVWRLRGEDGTLIETRSIDE